MARHVDALDLPLAIEDGFGYLADFSRIADRSPGAAVPAFAPSGRGRQSREMPGMVPVCPPRRKLAEKRD
jgi:hypothetical protein